MKNNRMIIVCSVSLAFLMITSSCSKQESTEEIRTLSPEMIEEIGSEIESAVGELAPFHEPGRITAFKGKKRTTITCGPARKNPNGTKTTKCCKWTIDEDGKITGFCKSITKLSFR